MAYKSWQRLKVRKYLKNKSQNITKNDWKFGGKIIYTDSLNSIRYNHNVAQDNKAYCVFLRTLLELQSQYYIG